MAANLWRGTTNSNWGTSTNWSLGAVPTNGDLNVATFDASSPNCIVDTSARQCNNIDFTGFTNTITMTNQITVSGAITLGASMLISGSGKMIADATATLTSAGKTWPNAFDFGTAGDTLTLADAWTVAGKVTMGTSTTGATINGFSITAQGDVAMGSTSGSVSGTTNLIMTGTGTYTPASTTGVLNMPFEINAPGQTVTILNGSTFRYGTSTAKITAGTLVSTNVALVLSGTVTFNFGGTWTTGSITWNNLTGSIGADLTFTGLLTFGGTSGTQTINGTANINCQAGLLLTVTSGLISGPTITLNITGTGTLSAPSMANTGRFNCPLVLNAPGGTITVSTLFTLNFFTTLYTAGTVVTNSGTWASGGGGGITQFDSTY